ncbi:hypothetical protein D6C77_07512 [Aureobasidium pullulans]|uniref:Spindle pole body-associated protein cut12 domain-containing protein n=1 Tax=Aureobasidium pullulans TaxID=5580 RepID=A0A4S9HDN9_AURPU|nr:hypothetical protein D6D29_05479 [Aureobasidium pullulans]THW42268.1 hypothetical protein D6D21_05953 [Aureobasidium pullulans]THX72148.1 hypothetical protein D6D08_05348 [Aureobasidium pullulans]TIA44807.1 hypothetical protein D6C83_05851 [Aureobasidium pullulans]TIA55021.1 hypothetical protein D6C77_07512 [Aureobasidium pullulans]
MLSWITGSKGAEEIEDPFPEAPETPAHVFAARAFKHAIFGTPAPPTEANYIQDTIIKQSIEVDSKPRTVAVEMPTRSQDDMNAIALPSAPGMSPTKPNGILMTPGTTRRNKTVSFGAQVVDNEAKNQARSGLPNAFPGKFPSPWTSKDTDGLGQSASASSRARTKLTAQLQEVRDSAQKGKTTQIQRAKDDTDLTMDYMEPRSQSGKYWKREYESYAENTQREMKKLVIKQKAAKDYAKEKEEEVTDLQAKLRQERLKVEKLEAKTKELAAQMKEFEKKISGQTGQDTQSDIARFKAENEHLRHDLDQVLGKKGGLSNSPKRKTPKAASAGDLWANAAFSSPFVDDAADKDQSPLRARDNNIQSQAPKFGKPKVTKSTHTKRLSEDTFDMSALPQPSPEPLPRTTPRSSRKTTADMTIDELVEKYSPEKPQFDRLALPLGIGTTLNFGSSKPEIKPPTTSRDLESGKPQVVQSKISSLSDERKAKAQARIEARRLSKLAAA